MFTSFSGNGRDSFQSSYGSTGDGETFDALRNRALPDDSIIFNWHYSDVSSYVGISSDGITAEGYDVWGGTWRQPGNHWDWASFSSGDGVYADRPIGMVQTYWPDGEQNTTFDSMKEFIKLGGRCFWESKFSTADIVDVSRFMDDPSPPPNLNIGFNGRTSEWDIDRRAHMLTDDQSESFFSGLSWEVGHLADPEAASFNVRVKMVSKEWEDTVQNPPIGCAGRPTVALDIRQVGATTNTLLTGLTMNSLVTTPVQCNQGLWDNNILDLNVVVTDQGDGGRVQDYTWTVEKYAVAYSVPTLNAMRVDDVQLLTENEWTTFPTTDQECWSFVANEY